MRFWLLRSKECHIGQNFNTLVYTYTSIQKLDDARQTENDWCGDLPLRIQGTDSLLVGSKGSFSNTALIKIESGEVTSLLCKFEFETSMLPSDFRRCRCFKIPFRPEDDLENKKCNDTMYYYVCHQKNKTGTYCFSQRLGIQNWKIFSK